MQLPESRAPPEKIEPTGADTGFRSGRTGLRERGPAPGVGFETHLETINRPMAVSWRLGK